MKNGLTYTHPGQGNPDIVGYAGPSIHKWEWWGRWTKVGAFWDASSTLPATLPPIRGILCKLDLLHGKDNPGALGPDVGVVFLQGCCGDIGQVDNLSPYAFPTGEKWAEIVGCSVGAEAVKVLVNAASGEGISMDGRTKVWKIKRRVPSAEHVRQSYELAQKDPKQVDMTDWVFAKETVLLDALLAKEPAAEVEVQAIQVGPAVFLTNPAEMFVEYGLELKAKSRFPLTFPIELAMVVSGTFPRKRPSDPMAAAMRRGSPVTATWRFRQGDKWWRRGLNWLGK